MNASHYCLNFSLWCFKFIADQQLWHQEVPVADLNQIHVQLVVQVPNHHPVTDPIYHLIALVRHILKTLWFQKSHYRLLLSTIAYIVLLSYLLFTYSLIFIIILDGTPSRIPMRRKISDTTTTPRPSRLSVGMEASTRLSTSRPRTPSGSGLNTPTMSRS